MLFSQTSMDTQAEIHRPSNGQLISVPHKDTIRLLEVYVKRSLSLNDGSLNAKKNGKKQKWVTIPRNQRLHSSDPSIHLSEDSNGDELGPFAGVDSAAKEPEVPVELEKPKKKSKKNKKPSFLKTLFGIFSRKSEDKSEDEDGLQEIPVVSQASDDGTTCLPTAPVASIKRRSSRKRSKRTKFPSRRLSLNKHNKSVKDINSDITIVNGKFVQ